LRLSRVDLRQALVSGDRLDWLGSRRSHQLLGHLLFDLSEICWYVHIRIVKLLLGKFSNFPCLQALLILEQAVGASEEALEGNHLLKESQL